MNNVTKKQKILLYVLLCVLAVVVVFMFAAKPKLDEADEIAKDTEAKQDEYDAAYLELRYAKIVAADIGYYEEEIEKAKGEYSEFQFNDVVSENISKILRDNEFEIVSVEIPEISPAEECPAFLKPEETEETAAQTEEEKEEDEESDEESEDEEADDEEEEEVVESGIYVTQLTYNIEGKYTKIADMTEEISKLDGCMTADFTADIGDNSAPERPVSDKTVGTLTVYYVSYAG